MISIAPRTEKTDETRSAVSIATSLSTMIPMKLFKSKAHAPWESGHFAKQQDGHQS